MGIFENIFSKKNSNLQQTREFFKTIDGYTPTFTKGAESLYEIDLMRSCINQFATMCGKLKPSINGNAYKELKISLENKPNPFMDTYKFLYKIATILSIHNTCFIIPMYDSYGNVVGLYPLIPTTCSVIDHQGKPYLLYEFVNGKKACIDFASVGIMTNFYYKNDFFGEKNQALNITIEMLRNNDEGIIHAIRNSPLVKFFGKVTNNFKKEHIIEARNEFNEINLSSENKSGMILADGRFSELKQLDYKAYTIDKDNLTHIKNNVFNYFGMNEDILQNKYDENTWNAYFEGKIEPFALQLSLVISNMLFSKRELSYGNSVTFNANRLQFASNQTKLEISRQLFDRGLITRNDIMDIWNLPHVEDGDKYYIRKEYAEMREESATTENERI